MSSIDWFVSCSTILFIIFYGMWKSRGIKNIDGFLLADRQLPWYHVGLSVMATQASAITFLSAPGQGYSDGMQFVQMYFGLPLAMIVLCVTFIPVFHKLNVYTAYEYLEKRFDNKTRSLTAGLFLLQRGISTGITIYAPALIISLILNVNINYTIVFTGILVILYTVYGGTKAVSYTQVLQMSVIFIGLFLAAFMILYLLPENVGFTDALHIAGKMDRLKAVDTEFDLNNKYNIWSGVIGGFFLHLSYFGTDQSQVGRYLTGKSIAQSRLGLIMNGLLKVPMQFIILLIGVLVFTFYQFHTPPVFFNTTEIGYLKDGTYKSEYLELETQHKEIHAQKQIHILSFVDAVHQNDKVEIKKVTKQIRDDNAKALEIRKEVIRMIEKNSAGANTDDSNFVFLTFITEQLPKGIIGLLIAIIFLAAMGSTASGINSLASTTVIDFYKRGIKKDGTDAQYLSASRWATIGWGIFCIVAALFASRIGNLIEAVNVLGSYFYGTILGIFLVAFYMKKVGGNAVFAAACITECIVIVAGYFRVVEFLWLNVIGCLLVMILAGILNKIMPKEIKTTK
jgi:solute:Na+ symporter, SSS family